MPASITGGSRRTPRASSGIRSAFVPSTAPTTRMSAAWAKARTATLPASAFTIPARAGRSGRRPWVFRPAAHHHALVMRPTSRRPADSFNARTPAMRSYSRTSMADGSGTTTDGASGSSGADTTGTRTGTGRSTVSGWKPCARATTKRKGSRTSGTARERRSSPSKARTALASRRCFPRLAPSVRSLQAARAGIRTSCFSA